MRRCGKRDMAFSVGPNGSLQKADLPYNTLIMAALDRQGIALAGGFVEENCGGSGGVEGFDAAGHGNADPGVGAAFDFLGETSTLVADEESDGFAPVYFPGGKSGLVCGVAKTGRQRPNVRRNELREKDGEGGAGENWQAECCASGRTKRFGREGAGGTALAGGGRDGGGGAKRGGGAEDGADVTGVLNSGEDDEKRSSAGFCRRENFVEGKLSRFDERGDALRMFGVGNAFEETVGGGEDGERDLFAIEIRR